jgi:uncharacterized delta-60 repeat protein
MCHFVQGNRRLVSRKSPAEVLRRAVRTSVELLEQRRLLSAGQLDTTFGTGGFTTQDVNSTFDITFDLAIQSNDKIVVAGARDFGGAQQAIIARFNADGSLDGTFATGGIYTVTIGDFSEFQSVAIDSAGNIIAAGTIDLTNADSDPRDVLIVRLTNTGLADGGFGNTLEDGVAIFDLQDTETANAVAVGPGGSIFVTGNLSGAVFVLKSLGDGTGLDPTFSPAGVFGPGVADVDFGDSDFSNAIAVQSDGKVVIAGFSQQSGDPDNHGTLARLNIDGSLDVNFGDLNDGIDNDNGGVVVLSNFSNIDDQLSEVAIDVNGPDVTIVSSGVYQDQITGGGGFVLYGLDGDGNIDLAYGTGGQVTFADANAAVFAPMDMVLDGNGRAIVSGGAITGSGTEIATIRVDRNGVLDSGFGTAGLSLVTLNGFDQGGAVGVQSSGRIIVAGAGVSDLMTFDVDLLLAGLQSDPVVAPSPVFVRQSHHPRNRRQRHLLGDSRCWRRARDLQWQRRRRLRLHRHHHRQRRCGQRPDHHRSVHRHRGRPARAGGQ